MIAEKVEECGSGVHRASLAVAGAPDNASWEEIVTHLGVGRGIIGHHRMTRIRWPISHRAAVGTRSPKQEGITRMAAMKPRTGDGPLEVTKEGRGIVMRVPLEGGGRLVVELSADEAGALGDALKDVVG